MKANIFIHCHDNGKFLLRILWISAKSRTKFPNAFFLSCLFIFAVCFISFEPYSELISIQKFLNTPFMPAWISYFLFYASSYDYESYISHKYSSDNHTVLPRYHYQQLLEMTPGCFWTYEFVSFYVILFSIKLFESQHIWSKAKINIQRGNMKPYCTFCPDTQWMEGHLIKTVRLFKVTVCVGDKYWQPQYWNTAMLTT